MANLIEQWKKRTRRKSIAMISFALVQVTAAAALLWRMAAKDLAWQGNACTVAALVWCASAAYPLLALLRVIFVPSVLNPDAVVPTSLLRELSRDDWADADTDADDRARSRTPKRAALTFRELLELDRS